MPRPSTAKTGERLKKRREEELQASVSCLRDVVFQIVKISKKARGCLAELDKAEEQYKQFLIEETKEQA